MSGNPLANAMSHGKKRNEVSRSVFIFCTTFDVEAPASISDSTRDVIAGRLA